MDFLNYKKYIKYKLKYLQLKQKKQIGGMDTTHIFKIGDFVTFKQSLSQNYVTKTYPGLHKLIRGTVVEIETPGRVNIIVANKEIFDINVDHLEPVRGIVTTRRTKKATLPPPGKGDAPEISNVGDVGPVEEVEENPAAGPLPTGDQDGDQPPVDKQEGGPPPEEEQKGGPLTEKKQEGDQLTEEGGDDEESDDEGDEFDTLIKLDVSDVFMTQLCINWGNHIHGMISNYDGITDKVFENMVEDISNFLTSLESGSNKYKYLHSYLYTIIYRIIDDIFRYPNSLVNFDTHLIQMEFDENGNDYQKIRYYIVKVLLGGDVYNPTDNNTDDDLADYNFLEFIFGSIDLITNEKMRELIQFSKDDSNNTSMLIIGLMNIVSHLYNNIDIDNIKYITKFIIGYYFCFCLKDLRYSGSMDDTIVVDINLDPLNDDPGISRPSLIYIASMINDSHHDKLFDTKKYTYIDLIEILLGIDTHEATEIFKKIFALGLADFNTNKTSTNREEDIKNPSGPDVDLRSHAVFNVSSKDTDLYKYMKDSVKGPIKLLPLSSQPLNLMVKDQANYFSSALFDQTSTPNGGSLLASKPAITINGPIMLDPGLSYRSAILKHTFLINLNSNIVYYIDLKNYTINIYNGGHLSYTITFSTEQNNDLTTFGVSTPAGKLYSAGVARHHMNGFDTIVDSDGNQSLVRNTEGWKKKQESYRKGDDIDYPMGGPGDKHLKQQIMMAKTMGDGAIGITALIGLGRFSDHYNIVNHLHTGDTAFLSIMIANAMLINNINIRRNETIINNKQYSFISSKERENNHFTNTEIKLITRQQYIVEDFKKSLETLNPKFFSDENQKIILSCSGIVNDDDENAKHIADIYDSVVEGLQKHRIGNTHTPVRVEREYTEESVRTPETQTAKPNYRMTPEGMLPFKTKVFT